MLEYWLSELPAGLSPASASTALGQPQARYPFYPATADSPAVLGGHVTEQQALDVLERHGVPTRVGWSPAAQSEGWPGWVWPAAAAAGVAAIAIAAGGVWRIRSR